MLGHHMVCTCCVLEPHPIQGLLKAREPVLTGQSIISEVHRVRHIGGWVQEEGQVDQGPLQPVHFQQVKLGGQEEVSGKAAVRKVTTLM